MTPEPNPKIVDVATLASAIRDCQERHYRTVHCHGAFQVLHPGHIRHLKWAKSQGKILSVGVIAEPPGDGMDDYPAWLRAENLAHLEFVDYVLIHDAEVPALLSRLKPDIYVKGREFRDAADSLGAERAAVEAYGGEIRFSSGDVVYELPGPERAARTQPLDPVSIAFCKRHLIGRERMIRLIDDIAGKRVVVVGETIVDEYVHCDPLGMSADSPTVVVRPTESDTFLGGAGIVAQHLAAMGAEPVFCSVVGEDVQADFTRAELERKDIEHALIVDGTRPTIHKKRFLAGGKKLLNLNSFRDQDVDARTANALCSAIESAGRGAAAVIVSDFSYGVVAPPVLETTVNLAKRNALPIVGDVQCSSQIGRVTKLKGLTAATPSEKEARMALWDRESGLADLGVKLLEETKHQSIVLTLGSRGLMILDTEGRPWSEISSPPLMHVIKRNLRIEYLPAFGNDLVDSMGAGDAMLAALTAALSAGASIMEAAYLGNCASAIEIAHLGNVPVTRDDLLDAVSGQLRS